jgi:DNA-3-methyladenine glycosylase
MHYLVNAVTEPKGAPAAILIRALDPIEGVEVMRRRRARRRLDARTRAIANEDLCCGPGNLTVALRIDLRQNTADLTAGPLTIQDYGLRPDRLARSTRIGIRVGTEKEWRCCWVGKTVSGRPADYRARRRMLV